MPFHSRDRQALIEQFAMPPRRRPGDIRGGQQRFIQDAGGGGGGAGPTSRVPQVPRKKGRNTYPASKNLPYLADRPLQTLRHREESIASGRPGVKESQAGRNLIDLGLDLDELDVENPYGFLQGEDINSIRDAEIYEELNLRRESELEESQRLEDELPGQLDDEAAFDAAELQRMNQELESLAERERDDITGVAPYGYPVPDQGLGPPQRGEGLTDIDKKLNLLSSTIEGQAKEAGTEGVNPNLIRMMEELEAGSGRELMQRLRNQEFSPFEDDIPF